MLELNLISIKEPIIITSFRGTIRTAFILKN